MTTAQIENNIKNLIDSFSSETFIFELLLAYGQPKATIARLKKGDLNQLENKGEITLRKKLFFKEVDSDLHKTIDTLIIYHTTQKQKPRFIIITDYKTLLAYDTKTTINLDIKFKDLVEHYDFFLPWAGMEKSQIINENPADVKASNQLAKLYDEILKNNPTSTHSEVHSLNLFLTRALFCYFAEDSNIFEDNIFTNSIASHTLEDGRDLDSYLERLFDLFNTEEKDREVKLPQYLKTFPYVNGGLFRDKQPLPKFTTKSRNIMIEIGKLDWSAINPDIFGSMIQAVVTPEHRGDMGMHYTSVPNIMKVMQPLFLDELHEEFDKVKTSKKKLQDLISRISSLKIFDPACGSGNFLIIAYKELRRLEMKILKAIDNLSNQRSFAFSEIKLTGFYGIELDDFAHEVAILSLWLTEHQMNLEFYKAFGRTTPSLPLKDGGNIVYGNATRIDWEKVCPKENGDEIYVLGNPPYLGSSMQNKEQKEDLSYIFNEFKSYKNLDYIACWFKKGTDYIEKINANYAFVSTNSICQGEQVALLWPYIFQNKQEINFAHQSFSWANNAKNKAAVIVVIVGIRNIKKEEKYIFNKNIKKSALNINPYLIEGSNIILERRGQPLSKLPSMIRGSTFTDNGNLSLTDEEKKTLISNEPRAEKFIFKLIGSVEFIRGESRWCLFIKNKDLDEAQNIPEIKQRLEKVVEFRLKSKAPSTVEFSNKPHVFKQFQHKSLDGIIVPRVSSIRRKYIPAGFIHSKDVILDSAQVIYGAEVFHLGIISSHLHMVWVRVTAGRLKSDYRYSSAVCYNHFPFPNISKKQKEILTEHTFNILDEREQHSEKTLAQLYDPNKMPQDLKEAHHQLDIAIEKCYRIKPFENDEERLEYLFKLYEKMIAKESSK